MRKFLYYSAVTATIMATMIGLGTTEADAHPECVVNCIADARDDAKRTGNWLGPVVHRSVSGNSYVR